jgi:SAM-dependent methyltransferase
VRGVPRFTDAETYVRNFSFEWTVHRRTQLDTAGSHESESTFSLKTGWSKVDLDGKSVLDVGCGMGRFLDVASRWGGEAIGVDLSAAVDAAYENLGRRHNVHVIQADVFALPFASESLDCIYSIGVLHHTPDCRRAFEQLPPLLAPHGQLAVWVYNNYNVVYDYTSQHYRRLTTRLPVRLLYALCYLAVPLYYLYKIPVFGVLARHLVPISDHPKWRWRILDTFDWYSPRYQSKHSYYEVVQWFRQAGLAEVEILEYPISCRGRKPA